MQVAGLTHPGRERSRNEDRYLYRETSGISLFVVADGMGGHVAGDMASGLAVDFLDRSWDLLREEVQAHCGQGLPFDTVLAKYVREANNLIFEEAGADPGKKGMGTTLTVGVLNGCELVIGHVGDSRAYLVDSASIALLTEDHSLVEELIQAGKVSPEEAQNHPQRHILTRALGVSPSVEIDLDRHILHEGAGLIFCTDGLTSLVREEEILSIFHEHDAPHQVAEALVRLANERGGYDNITVVLAKNIGRQEA